MAHFRRGLHFCEYLNRCNFNVASTSCLRALCRLLQCFLHCFHSEYKKTLSYAVDCECSVLIEIWGVVPQRSAEIPLAWELQFKYCAFPERLVV